MKNIFVAAVILFVSNLTLADNRQSIEGKIIFSEGGYFLTTGHNAIPLSGLNENEFRSFEGANVQLAGEFRSNGVLDVYKVMTKKSGFYTVAYDWDKIDQELYSN